MYVVFAFLLLPAHSVAEEQILSYSTLIRIQSSAELFITETIRVRSEGDSIRHGIFRDFPVRYRDGRGLAYHVPFEVLKVERDGSPEEYHFERRGDFHRLYMGSSSALVPDGIHTYMIIFRTNRQIGYLPDHDELYFDAIGDEWDFPILQSEVQVALPAGVPLESVRYYGYTGPRGSKDADYRAGLSSSGTIRFTGTKPLDPGSGFTIVVEWPKGHVHAPTASEKRAYFLQDNRFLLGGAAGFIFLLGYFAFAWTAVGRDPAKGTIIPLYGPPKNFSPAACRYLSKMRFDNPALACVIMNLAVKGAVKIEEHEERKYVLRRTGGELPEDLAPEEKAVYAKLFAARTSPFVVLGAALNNLFQPVFGAKLFNSLPEPGEKGEGPSTVQIDSSSSSVILSAVTACTESLRRQFDDKLFSRNRIHFIPMIIFAVVTAVFLFQTESVLIIVSGLAAIAGIMFAFKHLISAPSITGRRILDRIEGFKMYLGTAEEERLNFENPPERTPRLFEMFLPYAFALGVDQEWSEQFEQVLTRAGMMRDGRYSSGWYSGHVSYGGFSDFGSSIGSSISHSITSSMPSSSGSGGSSGGGGGGGGGGGW